VICGSSTNIVSRMDINKLLGIKMVNGSLDDEKGGTRNLIHGNGCEMPCATKLLLETCTSIFGVAWDAVLSLHKRLRTTKKYYFSVCAIFKDEPKIRKQSQWQSQLQ